MKVFAGAMGCVALAVSIFALVRSQGELSVLIELDLLLTLAPFFHLILSLFLAFTADSANSSSSPQDLEPRVPGDVQRVPQVAELEPDRESAVQQQLLGDRPADTSQSGISSEGYKGKGMVMVD